MDAVTRSLLESPWTLGSIQLAFIRDLQQGVVIVDEKGHLMLANERAIAIHGQLRPDVDPQDYSAIYGVFTTENRPFPSTDLPLSRAVLNGEFVPSSLWMVRRPDGYEVKVRGAAVPLFDGQKRHVGCALVFEESP
ncbi:PAS domain-containing protein [Dyella sp. EPa41]|uniref:PAS domain-containing protein n=1 Tax=Dyella sp. EPa41 TaxID=1561194 RepID=UPI001916A38D|nr:PAS domain-containing protein [Dyella sp. EPa41]